MYGYLLEQRLTEGDDWDTYDYVGTLSWKAPHKIIIPDIHALARRLERDKGPGTPPSPDVVAFYFNTSRSSLTTQAKSHALFNTIWFQLMDQLGLDAVTIDKTVRPFYSNYWIAKPSWMKKYIAFYKKAQHVMDTYTSIQTALWSNIGYPLSSSMNQTRCLEVFSRPYYPYHPFICERLPCVFFTLQGAHIHYHTPPTNGTVKRANCRIVLGPHLKT